MASRMGPFQNGPYSHQSVTPLPPVHAVPNIVLSLAHMVLLSPVPFPSPRFLPQFVEVLLILCGPLHILSSL